MKQKLTIEKLAEFLRPYEPVSIAWRLHITSKGIDDVLTRNLFASHCCTEL
jgi:hypothetical protein